MKEIALLVQATLDDLGAETLLIEETLPRADIGWTNLVVAPHEFFPLFPGASESECLEAAARSVLLSVEQPGTPWFGIGNRYSAVAASVLDINALAAEELRNAGIDAHWLRLGYHPSWDRWGGDSSSQREHDVVYLGSLTGRREVALATLSETLVNHDCRFVIHDGAIPVTETASNFVWGDAKHDLMAQSRILLNVHRSRLPYFEWHRHLGALANGCVVLTEPSASYEPLVPWEHFAVAPEDALGEYLSLLLASPDLVRRIADSAYAFIRSELVMTTMMRPLLDVLAAAATQHPGLSAGVRRRLYATPGGRDQRRRRGGDLEPPPPNVSTATAADRSIKQLLITQTKLNRELARMRFQLETGEEQRVDVQDTPVFLDTAPEISVIVPVHDYESYVAPAIKSAIESRGVVPEIIVVDDSSSDGSRAVVEKLMQDHPYAAIRFLTVAVNLGVCAVRNLALEHARADAVFFLDADNLIYPDSLRRLQGALAANPEAALAYGMIATFGAEQRLVSVYPWDVRRLVRGNYIDVMALVRREILQEVGGFNLDMQGIGWEDYELWLRLAAAGHTGVHVPTFIGAYRTHAAQRTLDVNHNVGAIFEEMHERFPTLPWPSGKIRLPSDFLSDPSVRTGTPADAQP